jgi:glycosyltransferase involved in cell wall biosynthesis
LVSVVIPTKGRSQLLRRAIDSVLRQTLRNIEIIVVIDGNDDETKRTAESFHDGRLRVIENAIPQGGAEARNIGVRRAKAEWVAFLDDDDEFLPNKLEEQYKIAVTINGSKPIIYCRIIGRSPLGDYIWPQRSMKRNEHISDYILARNSLFQGEGLIQTTMLFVDRELLIKVPFSKDLKCHQEWDWILKAWVVEGSKLIMCEKVLAVWYIEENRNSISSRSDWKYSAEWIRENQTLVTKRAYAAFLMVKVSSAAKHDLRAFWPILKDAVVNGSPTWIDYLLFLGIWLIPQEQRRRLRKLRHSVSEV